MVAVVVALLVGAGIIVVAISSRDEGPADDIAADDTTTVGDEATPDAIAPSEDIADPTADAPVVTCPVSANVPEVRRVWQDESGTHVVMVIATTCEADQIVDDPAARFGLFVGADPLVAGTFDLSQASLALPAGGETGELDLVFDAEADAGADLRARVTVAASEAESGPGGFDLRYVVRCSPGGGGQATATVDAASGASLADGESVSSGGADPTVVPLPDFADDAAAVAVLERIHTEDAAARAALSGPWVAQVSAKRLDGEPTYDVFTGEVIAHTPTVFLDKLRAWEASYGSEAVVLIKAPDFLSICGAAPTAQCSALWIVAVNVPSDTPEGVFDGWCGPEGLNDRRDPVHPDELNCFAKRYVAEPPAGTSFYGS